MSYHNMSAVSIAEKVKSGEFSVSEIIRASLEGIEKMEGTLNALITREDKIALRRAEFLERWEQIAVYEGQ